MGSLRGMAMKKKNQTDRQQRPADGLLEKRCQERKNYFVGLFGLLELIKSDILKKKMSSEDEELFAKMIKRALKPGQCIGNLGEFSTLEDHLERLSEVSQDPLGLHSKTELTELERVERMLQACSFMQILYLYLQATHQANLGDQGGLLSHFISDLEMFVVFGGGACYGSWKIKKRNPGGEARRKRVEEYLNSPDIRTLLLAYDNAATRQDRKKIKKDLAAMGGPGTDRGFFYWLDRFKMQNH